MADDEPWPSAEATSVQRMRMPGCEHCASNPDHDPVAIRENGYDGYRCNDCNLIYVSPRPDPRNIVNLYDHDSAQVSAREMIDAYESFGKKLKARFTLSLIRRHCRGDSLLEIGPGGGGFLRQARKRYRVHAAEFNPAQVAHLRALGIDCRRGPFADTFSGETFDVIYLCDVLSHFFDPVAELSAMRVMLNPGGIVVLETGNNGDLDRRHYRSIDRWQYPDHLFFFSEKSLEHLAKASGFSIASKHAYSRVVEMLLDRKLKPAKGAAKGTRSVPSTPTVKRRLIKTAMSAKHTVDYFLIYRLGAFLPKPGRPQTLIAVLTIR